MSGFFDAEHLSIKSITNKSVTANSNTDLWTPETSSHRIRLYEIVITVSGATRITVRDEDGTVIGPILRFTGEGSVHHQYKRPVQLGFNKRLQLNSTEAVVLDAVAYGEEQKGGV